MTHQHNEDTHTCGGGCCGGHHHEHHDHNHGNPHACGGGCCGGAALLSQEERDFLLTLLERQFLPMAQFVVKSSQTDEFEMVALSPVYMEHTAATMDEVRQIGDMLYKLEDMGLLTLDDEESLDPMSYEVYQQSDLFALLTETVTEGAKLGGALGDIPTIQYGSIAVTQQCIDQFTGK